MTNAIYLFVAVVINLMTAFFMYKLKGSEIRALWRWIGAVRAGVEKEQDRCYRTLEAKNIAVAKCVDKDRERTKENEKIHNYAVDMLKGEIKALEEYTDRNFDRYAERLVALEDKSKTDDKLPKRQKRSHCNGCKHHHPVIGGFCLTCKHNPNICDRYVKAEVKS